MASFSTVQVPDGSSLRDRKQQRTRDAIYAAALELFAASEYADVTVEGICARADVGRATFFRMFGSKAGLIVEFNRRIAERARAMIDASQASSAQEQLELLRQAISESWSSSPRTLQDCARDSLRNPSLSAAAPGSSLRVLVNEIVRDGQKRGELSRALRPELIARLLVVALGAVTIDWFGHEPGELHRNTRAALKALLNGLATQPRQRART